MVRAGEHPLVTHKKSWEREKTDLQRQLMVMREACRVKDEVIRDLHAITDHLHTTMGNALDENLLLIEMIDDLRRRAGVSETVDELRAAHLAYRALAEE